MKLRIALLSLLTILCLALSTPVFAGELYTNGPTNGTNSAYFIDVNQVTDSFPLPPGSETTGFTFAEWVPAGATPVTVDWSIGTSPFGEDVGSGIGVISATLLCSSGQPFNGGICGGGFGYDVYAASVQAVFAGQAATVWLTLSNATDNSGGRDGWDVNFGPSLAYESQLGSIPSESFTIEGSGTTPEPSSIILFGSGILGIAGILRRRLNI
jgi:hypothetical protein